MKCMHKGCENDAICAIAVDIPAVGWPLDAHQPMTLYTGLKVCKEHLDEVNPKTMFPEETKEMVRSANRVLHRAAPDFDRAMLRQVALDSPELSILEGGKETRQ